MGKRMNKENFRKWFTLCILILGGGTIYKLASIKDAFYVPLLENLGISNTQLGVAMSIYGTIGTFGYFISIYISDRFSKKILLPISLIGVGCVGLYFSTLPGYIGLVITFALLAIFDTVIYWPVLLKAVRLLGREDEQGRMFGFLEAGRGVVDTIVASTALAIFSFLGESKDGLRAAILFYSILPIIIGIVSFFLLENDPPRTDIDTTDKHSANKATLKGIITALKMPEIWIVSLNIFAVYGVYIGLTYFMPFLNEIYAMPVTLVGVYGIINQYGLKIIGGPVGGFLADKKFHSASKFMRVAFGVTSVFMVVMMILPHQKMNIYSGMFVTLAFGAVVFAMRAVFFAPVEEVRIPREISGAAMSIASFVGYMPYMFAYTVYGYMLDTYPGMKGYELVFSIMIAFSVFGLLVSTFLVRAVNRKRAQEKAEKTEKAA